MRTAAMVLAAGLTVTAGASTAGASGNSAASTPKVSSSGAVASLKALVPASIRKAGVLVVASDSDFPPFEFLAANGKTVTGVSADLLRKALSLLGLRPQVKIVNFDSIVPGFASKRYLVSMAAVNVTSAREKVVDFVTWDQQGNSFYQAAGSNLSLPSSYSAICGMTVAVEEGSSQAATAQAESKHCTAIGKPTKILQFTAQASVNLALQSKRADFGLTSSGAAGYLISTTNGQFKLAVKPFNFTTVTGWAVGKTSGMVKPLEAALKYMSKTGSYEAIMLKWGQQSDELKSLLVTS